MDAALREVLNCLPDRVVKKIQFLDDSGCWKYLGGGVGRTYDTSYGFVGVNKRKWVLHRLTYGLLNGAVPTGLVLDHFLHPEKGCIGPRCCNPLHVRPRTQQENILRGSSRSAANAEKTHCPRGHEYTPENTRYRNDRGRLSRQCIICVSQQNRIRNRRMADRRKAQGLNTRGQPKQVNLNPERDKRFGYLVATPDFESP
jgi:hypothetical protein